MEWKQLTEPVLWFMAALVSAAYLIVPITNDGRIYLGVAHIASNFYPFPQGIDLAWEIKPIANRLTNVILYKISAAFVPFDNHFLFGLAVKTLTLIAIVVVAWYFAKVVEGKYTFLLVFFSFTAIANFCVLQAEYWAALWAVLSIALLVSQSRVAWTCSGALMIWIFLLKGISGLLIVPILCGAYLLISRTDDLDFLRTVFVWYNNIQRVVFYSAGFISGSVMVLIAHFLWWPNIVSDILISPQLARVGISEPINLLVWFFAQGIMSPLYIPVLVIGYIFGAIFYVAWVRYQDSDIRIAYIAMWIAPALIVIIQGEVFLYHYLAFVPSAIVTVVMCERMTV